MSVSDVAEHFDLDWKTVKDIDNVRNREKRRADKQHRDVHKGTKYLLLKRNLSKPGHREHFKQQFSLNETISRVMILRGLLPKLWDYRQDQSHQKKGIRIP
jgi:hypothetical protein